MTEVVVEVFNSNFELRGSYPIARSEQATVEDYAHRALSEALREGSVHKDEAKFCRMKVRDAEATETSFARDAAGGQRPRRG